MAKREVIVRLDMLQRWLDKLCREEWTVEVVPYFNTDLMERCLALYSHVKILASGKVGGVHKFYYHAEQVEQSQEIILTKPLG